ncbi:MAG: type II secretion system protein GspN [Nitrospirae bacterium]|nr:type II secretion system protein GspN [Candidatus Troglogloeales bacterium]
MKQMQTNTTQNKWLLRLGYLFFGAIAFLIFFYATFPFYLAQKKMVLAFETETGCQVDPKDQTVLIPLRLRWHNVKVLCPSVALVTLESINADLALLPILLKRTGEIDFKIKIAEQGGEISGTIIIDPTPAGIAFSIKKQGIGVHFNHRGFSGILDIKGGGSWVGYDPSQGAGGFDFNLKEAHIKNQAMPWPMNDIFFANIHGKVAYENGVLLMGDFSADGENATLTTNSGSLILHEPFSESFVSITLKVSPKGQLKQVAALLIPGYSAVEPLTLAITGALTSPKVLLNGRRLPTS